MLEHTIVDPLTMEKMMRFYPPVYGPNYDSQRFDEPSLPTLVIHHATKDWELITANLTHHQVPYLRRQAAPCPLAQRFWRQVAFSTPIIQGGEEGSLTWDELIRQVAPKRIFIVPCWVLLNLEAWTPRCRFSQVPAFDMKADVYPLSRHEVYVVHPSEDLDEIPGQADRVLAHSISALALGQIEGITRVPSAIQQSLYDYYAHHEPWGYLELSDLQGFLTSASRVVACYSLAELKAQLTVGKFTSVLAFKRVDTLADVTAWFTELEALEGVDTFYSFTGSLEGFQTRFHGAADSFLYEAPLREWYLAAAQP